MFRALALFALCAVVASQDLLFEYGAGHGDTALHRNDDGYSDAIPISTLFPFFGQTYSSLFVSTVTSAYFNNYRRQCIHFYLSIGLHQRNHLIQQRTVFVHTDSFPRVLSSGHRAVLGRCRHSLLWRYLVPVSTIILERP